MKSECMLVFFTKQILYQDYTHFTAYNIFMLLAAHVYFTRCSHNENHLETNYLLVKWTMILDILYPKRKPE